MSFRAATSVFGMTINTTKTNCLSVGYGVCLKDLVSVNSLPGTVKCVEFFLYVGGLVAPAAHSTLDVAYSAAVVSGVFYALKNVVFNSGAVVSEVFYALKNVVFNSADLTLNTQHHIYMYMYCGTVITLLVYASGNCTQDLQRLGAFYYQ